MPWIAALGIAFGGTYLMCMPLRTVRYPSLFWSTFFVSYAAAVAAIYYIGLQVEPQIFLGVGGVVLGAALFLIRRKTKKMEQNYRQTRIERGEKIKS